jgi:hypothetical protein
MEKRCYVCGQKINKQDIYYQIGSNSYICNKPSCYNFYYWDNLATRMISDKYHEYVIVDKKVYQIGSDQDEPQGFGGKYWSIQFNDGTHVDTHSLWYKGELPKRLQHDFKDNAKFLEH